MAKADLSQYTEAELASALRSMIAARIESEYASALGIAPKAPGRAVAAVSAKGVGKAPAKARKAPAKRTAPAHCIYHWPSGCSNPHRGPGAGYLCDKHREIPKADKTASRAAYDANNKNGKPVATTTKGQAAKKK